MLPSIMLQTPQYIVIIVILNNWLLFKEIFKNKEIVFLFIDILCPILFISLCRLKMIIFLLPKAFFYYFLQYCSDGYEFSHLLSYLHWR